MRVLLFCLVLSLHTAATGSHHRIDPIPASLDEDVLIVDVRTRGEFRDEHLRNAVHVYYEDIVQGILRHSNDKDRQIVLYCTIGMRAHHAKQDLVRAGYTRVLNLGGLEELKEAGFDTD